MEEKTGLIRRFTSRKAAVASAAAVLVFAALYWTLLSGHRHFRPAAPRQKAFTPFALRMNGYWRERALEALRYIGGRHEALVADAYHRLDEAARALPVPDPGARESTGSYGTVPTVYVDKSYGARFPAPVYPPVAFSWHDLLLDIETHERDLDELSGVLGRWKNAVERDPALRDPLTAVLGEELESRLLRAETRLGAINRRARYLRSWVSDLQDPGHAGTLLASAIEDARKLSERSVPRPRWEKLHETLRPWRQNRFPYVPDSLDAIRRKGLSLEIVTDVTDPAFLSEMEGAIDVHWSDSPWGRKNGVRFELKWEKVPVNEAFLAGEEGLMSHLARFPKDRPAMTTGGSTTYVVGNIMVLGPEKITPRTLAHEFGHLLGFADCYYRTLSGYGPFGTLGVAVMEWSNPLYPDELMCDNNAGAVSRIAW